ncbi:sugar phosphate nucleotidyltransferase [Sulfuricella sp.]|uniref:sugar phosphate nucleotidyltransferase n=1 Tax=Sulfuricella sp. TaxID=2099377 RepID=UPI0039C96A9E
MLIPIILSGGVGARLWPVSRAMQSIKQPQSSREAVMNSIATPVKDQREKWGLTPMLFT